MFDPDYQAKEEHAYFQRQNALCEIAESLGLNWDSLDEYDLKKIEEIYLHSLSEAYIEYKENYEDNCF